MTEEPNILYEFGRVMCEIPYGFGITLCNEGTIENKGTALEILRMMRERGQTTWIDDGEGSVPSIPNEETADRIIQEIKQRFPDEYINHGDFPSEMADDNLFFHKGINLSSGRTEQIDEVRTIVGKVLDLKPSGIGLHLQVYGS